MDKLAKLHTRDAPTYVGANTFICVYDVVRVAPKRSCGDGVVTVIRYMFNEDAVLFTVEWPNGDSGAFRAKELEPVVTSHGE